MRTRYLKNGDPVVSVDTRKKELIGTFRTEGACWRQAAIDVWDHEFPSWATGKAVPFGIYDIARNAGFVVVGLSHETSQFAVSSIAQKWWRKMVAFTFSCCVFSF